MFSFKFNFTLIILLIRTACFLNNSLVFLKPPHAKTQGYIIATPALKMNLNGTQYMADPAFRLQPNLYHSLVFGLLSNRSQHVYRNPNSSQPNYIQSRSPHKVAADLFKHQTVLLRTLNTSLTSKITSTETHHHQVAQEGNGNASKNIKLK